MHQAKTLRDEANVLQQNAPAASTLVQLGMGLLDGRYTIARCLKEWDARGKGEVLKGGMRNNLRNVGLNVTSVEADELFDGWDDDKGGTLDMDELKAALIQAQEAAQDFKTRPNPAHQRADMLLKNAQLAEEAADATARAEALEAELVVMNEEMETRADVKLGALLQKRMVKPGAVVSQWARSRGAHAGQLSKADFRNAVLDLFKTGRDKNASPPPSHRKPGTSSSPERESSVSLGPLTSVSEIDAVFDSFDEDHGGYLDRDEAKNMIKGLQIAAEKAESDRRAKEREARIVRASSMKLAAQAMASIAENLQEAEGLVPKAASSAPTPPPPPPAASPKKR